MVQAPSRDRTRRNLGFRPIHRQMQHKCRCWAAPSQLKRKNVFSVSTSPDWTGFGIGSKGTGIGPLKSWHRIWQYLLLKEPIKSITLLYLWVPNKCVEVGKQQCVSYARGWVATNNPHKCKDISSIISVPIPPNDGATTEKDDQILEYLPESGAACE